jgi:hypothetical protein
LREPHLLWDRKELVAIDKAILTVRATSPALNKGRFSIGEFCGPVMGLFKRDLFEAIVLASSCVASCSAVADAYEQSAAPLQQFSDPNRNIARPASSVASGSHKTIRLPKNLKGRPAEIVGAKKQSIAASAPSTMTWTLDDPYPASMAPAAPSIATSVPDKDTPLGFGLKWYGANDPYHNAATSTIPGVDQIMRDSDQLLGEPSSTGSGIEAGLNLKF